MNKEIHDIKFQISQIMDAHNKLLEEVRALGAAFNVEHGMSPMEYFNKKSEEIANQYEENDRD